MTTPTEAPAPKPQEPTEKKTPPRRFTPPRVAKKPPAPPEHVEEESIDEAPVEPAPKAETLEQWLEHDNW